MRFESIASGSSGNCIYVGSANTHLLMDVVKRKRKSNEVNYFNKEFRNSITSSSI